MKSYKELSNVLKNKINQTIKNGGRNARRISHLIDTWLAFAERDWETPEDVKREKARELLEYVEGRITNVDFESKELDWVMNLTFSYIALRQVVEPIAENEREARMYHIGV